MKRQLITSLLFSSLLGAAQCITTKVSNSFKYQFDTDIDFFEGQYIWYGINFGCGEEFCGIESWSSDDLQTWSSNGLMIDPADPTIAALCAQGGNCGRPHIVYSAETSTYVLWVNAGVPGYVIFTSSSSTSGYTLSSERALVGYQPSLETTQAGDFSIWPPFKQSIYLQQLTPDLTNTTGNVTHLAPVGDLVDYEAESPDIFFRNGYYYVSASNTCGFCQGTLLIIYRSRSITGPWTRQIISADTCSGQTTSVLRIPSHADSNDDSTAAYIHQADLFGIAPIAGTRTAAHGHQFQALNFNDDGSVIDLDCDPSVSTTIELPTTSTYSNATSSNGTSTETMTLGSGNSYQDYFINCTLPQYALYQTFPVTSSGNLSKVGINLAGAGPTGNVSLTVFRYSNDTALVAPFYVWETLAAKMVQPEEISQALMVVEVEVGAQVKSGDKLGIAVLSEGVSNVCVGMRSTGNGTMSGSGGKLFADGVNQVSMRGPIGKTSPVVEWVGQEMKWFAIVE
ncbi:glycoside hydrolase family 43 protein [Rutstroemia sp. NJR-2017a BBW]|nr:glycoside hydrolase family 43 protein [Rutstroemia sp. NJR-2017a BBW]